MKQTTSAKVRKEHRENTIDLYNRLIEAAEKNAGNPTGKDYARSARRIIRKYPHYFTK